MTPWFLLPLVALFLFGIWFVWYVGRNNEPKLLKADKAHDATYKAIKAKIAKDINSTIKVGRHTESFSVSANELDVYEDILEEFDYEFDTSEIKSDGTFKIKVKW
jgi:hypothetical protein